MLRERLTEGRTWKPEGELYEVRRLNTPLATSYMDVLFTGKTHWEVLLTAVITLPRMFKYNWRAGASQPSHTSGSDFIYIYIY